MHDNTTHKNDLVNYEVRAGLSSLPANYKGRILKNVRCGRIEIRGGEDRVYPIVCDQAIIANYITIQIIDDNAVLQINELEVMDGKDGKCHKTLIIVSEMTIIINNVFFLSVAVYKTHSSIFRS